jgi:phenylacetic acid degradation operon negative regulatory protein
MDTLLGLRGIHCYALSLFLLIGDTLHAVNTSDNMSNISFPVPSVTEIVLDLLSSYPSHELSVGSLCRAAALFGMAEQGVRVALTRLVRRGKVISRVRGVYALDESTNSLFRETNSWLRREKRLVSWDGLWVGVADSAVSRQKRAMLREHERALAIKGFQQLQDGLHLRPDNLAGGIQDLRKELHGLGLAERALVVGLHDLSLEDERRARALWNVVELRQGYQGMLEDLERSNRRLDCKPVEAAAVESLLLGRSIIRRIVRDPLLPEELLPGLERQRLTQEMHDYQLRSKALWAKVLQEEPVSATSPE